jgi:NarL family two-component system sensor histidine kinase YdfH
MYMRQAEARTQAQALAKELEKANQQLSEYADRVEDLTIANERQRMARELHDTLSQGLAGLILQLEAADANLSANHPEKARAIVQQTMDHARATLESSRRAIDNLRQPELEGLEDAIRHESSRFSDSTKTHCELHLVISHPVPEPIREAVVRSISEALRNISLHAGAKRVGISAEIDENKLEVTITDDGKGFDPAHILPGHYGILGIRERIQLVGGTFEITSSPKSGTTLVILIPIKDEEM